VLGRDASVEISVRDPATSRRHARLAHDGQTFTIEDLDSRAGTRIGGAPIAGALPLRGEGDLFLGDRCHLRFRITEGGPLALHGQGGLDGALHAIIGRGSIDLTPVFPGAEGLTVTFTAGSVRLDRGAVTLKIAGRLVGAGCDLMSGDAIEIAGGPTLHIA
jgi:hypothetical protein